MLKPTHSSLGFASYFIFDDILSAKNVYSPFGHQGNGDGMSSDLQNENLLGIQ